jgi:hypothetical protein
MANDTFIYTIRVNSVRNILEHAAANCPSKREAEIQNAKLDRMVFEFRKKFTIKQVTQPSTCTPAMRKKIGMETHRLECQSKLVRKLMDKTMEEDYFTNYEPAGTRRDFRIEVAKANRQLDKRVFEATQQFRKKILAAAAEHRRLTK